MADVVSFEIHGKINLLKRGDGCRTTDMIKRIILLGIQKSVNFFLNSFDETLSVVISQMVTKGEIQFS